MNMNFHRRLWTPERGGLILKYITYYSQRKSSRATLRRESHKLIHTVHQWIFQLIIQAVFHLRISAAFWRISFCRCARSRLTHLIHHKMVSRYKHMLLHPLIVIHFLQAIYSPLVIFLESSQQTSIRNGWDFSKHRVREEGEMGLLLDRWIITLSYNPAWLCLKLGFHDVKPDDRAETGSEAETQQLFVPYRRDVSNTLDSISTARQGSETGDGDIPRKDFFFRARSCFCRLWGV